jgi:hypothetical protein
MLICNYGPTPNKNRGSSVTLIVSKSDRRIEMNKLFIDNNYTKSSTNNFNIIFTKTDRLCGLVVRVLATDPEARVQFPALPEKQSSGSGTGSTQPREYN